MIISLISYPRLGSMQPLAVSKSGQELIVNGEAYDFSVIPDGSELPHADKATGCWHFHGPIRREDGDLHITLRMPISDRPTQSQAFPEPIHVTDDGPVHLPADDPDLDGKTAQEIYDGN